METIRHMALGCCVIATVAGVIRVFWPENGFAPVINAVLALYIITAGLQMLHATDWQGLTQQLYRLADTKAPAEDYGAYGQQIAREASAQAVGTVLRQSGIQAVVTLQDGVCRVELTRSSDQARASALLDASCGEMDWEIAAGGEEP